MSFHRRWFFTAAGSAFLAGFARMMEANGNAPGVKKPAVDPAPDPDRELLLKSFEDGYGKGRAANPDLPALTPDDREYIYEPVLTEIYGKHFDKRWKKLDAGERGRVAVFAGVAGYIAGQAVIHHKKGECGWDQKAGAKLQKDHIQYACFALGFILNGKVRKDLADKNLLCNTDIPFKKPGQGTEGPVSILQLDEACPLCPP